MCQVDLRDCMYVPSLNSFYVVCRSPLFSKLTFSNNSLRNTVRVSNGLHPYEDQHSVGPYLHGSKLLAKAISRWQKSTLAKEELVSS